ncbi:hypothetical protein TNCV_3264031 [Trichonephila clavipes]|nr:hypothetical protein TNCV_3264031 [Trichonephila clavipes]
MHVKPAQKSSHWCGVEVRKVVRAQVSSSSLDHGSKVLGVKKRRINNVLSFTPDSVTTARLKTYNVHSDIGAHGARDEMCRDRQGRQRDNRSRELRPTGQQKKKTRSREPSPIGAVKGQTIRRMIRQWME